MSGYKARSKSDPRDVRIRPENNPGTWSNKQLADAREIVQWLVDHASATTTTTARHRAVGYSAVRAGQIRKAFEKARETEPLCAALKSISLSFPEVSSGEIAQALPEVNRRTIYSMVSQSRK